MDNAQQVNEMLESDSPPTHALGDTTDYRQMVAAWGKSHGLSYEEIMQALETTGSDDSQRLLDEMKRNPEAEHAFRLGLSEPLSGDTATVTDDRELDDRKPVEDSAER